MKKFNKKISIEISIDSIASKLLEQFASDAPHKEIIVEAIIGRFATNDTKGLGFLYSALNGWVNELDFKVGQEVKLNDFQKYGYWNAKQIVKKDTGYGKVETGKIIDIDQYSDRPIKIEFSVPNELNENNEPVFKTQTDWISISQIVLS